MYLYPSIESDTGEHLRTGQHLLTVMLNKSKSSKEIADTQAALILLNMPSQFGSIKNTYLFINDACRSMRKRINNDIKNNNKEDISHLMEQKILSKSIEEIKVTTDKKKTIALTYTTMKIWENMKIMKYIQGDPHFIKLTQILQYRFHKKLTILSEEFSILEYVPIIVILPIQTNNN